MGTIDEWHLAASARGVPLAGLGAREIKAVTYSEMAIEETDDGWHAYVVSRRVTNGRGVSRSREKGMTKVGTASTTGRRSEALARSRYVTGTGFDGERVQWSSRAFVAHSVVERRTKSNQSQSQSPK